MLWISSCRYEIGGTILTCLNQGKELSFTDGWTDPNYRKASLFQSDDDDVCTGKFVSRNKNLTRNEIFKSSAFLNASVSIIGLVHPSVMNSSVSD